MTLAGAKCTVWVALAFRLAPYLPFTASIRSSSDDDSDDSSPSFASAALLPVASTSTSVNPTARTSGKEFMNCWVSMASSYDSEPLWSDEPMNEELGTESSAEMWLCLRWPPSTLATVQNNFLLRLIFFPEGRSIPWAFSCFKTLRSQS